MRPQGLVTFENEVSARVFQTTTACANVTHRNAVRSCAMIWATFPGMHAGAERSSWWRWRPASRRLTSREGDSRKPCWNDQDARKVCWIRNDRLLRKRRICDGPYRASLA